MARECFYECVFNVKNNVFMKKFFLVVMLLFAITVNINAKDDFEQSIIDEFEYLAKQQSKNQFKPKGIDCKVYVSFDRSKNEIVVSFNPSTFEWFKNVEASEQAELYTAGLAYIWENELSKKELDDVVSWLKFVKLNFHFVVTFTDSYGAVLTKNAVMTPADVEGILQDN